VIVAPFGGGACACKRLARPGDSVTESNTLRDSVTGADREVDVVIEGDIRGNRLMISPGAAHRHRHGPQHHGDQLHGLRRHHFICDREMIEDPWELVDGLHASLDELTATDREEARQARRRYRGVSQAR
jgi:hypothetical protein